MLRPKLSAWSIAVGDHCRDRVDRDPGRGPTVHLARQLPGQAADPADRDRVRGESYSSHPAETRFSSTHFTRLHQMPLIGADPKEERIDAAYGVAESWSFLPGAKGMIVNLRDGLAFNDGTPITADDVVFSLSLSASKFADPQISGTLNGIGVTAKAIDAKTVQFDFAKGSPTFDVEISAMVFPLYVTSKAYHSNGEISQAAFDRFRAKPLAAGPYRVVARQAKESITLAADRRDPLLGCPACDRIEIREVWRPARG
jgi:ABC-type transport system substrate-binding protein